jgi:cyclopropane fatty-acyl-phospholipid synthase-like methyltransferase
MVRRHVKLEGAALLDIGCGLGTYVRRFSDFTPRACGIDIDSSRLVRGAEDVVRLVARIDDQRVVGALLAEQEAVLGDLADGEHADVHRV